MNKLFNCTCVMYIVFLSTYFLCLIVPLSPRDTAFMTFGVSATALISVMIWELGETILFPALAATLSTLAALVSLEGLGHVPISPTALLFWGIAGIALWTSKELNLGFILVLLNFAWLAIAIYLPLVGFHFYT